MSLLGESLTLKGNDAGKLYQVTSTKGIKIPRSVISAVQWLLFECRKRERDRETILISHLVEVIGSRVGEKNTRTAAAAAAASV